MIDFKANFLAPEQVLYGLALDDNVEVEGAKHLMGNEKLIKGHAQSHYVNNFNRQVSMKVKSIAPHNFNKSSTDKRDNSKKRPSR